MHDKQGTATSHTRSIKTLDIFRSLIAIGGLMLVMATSPLSAAQLPDLVLRLSAPAQARPGEDIGSKVKIAVYNLGSGVARGTSSSGKNGYMVDLFLTHGPLPSGFARYTDSYHDGVLLRGGRVSNTGDLGASARRSYRVGGGIPLDTRPGDYRLCAQVDPGHVIRESNESNNITCRPLKIAALQIKPLPEFKIIGPSGPSNRTALQRRVLSDGTIELRYPDGSRRQLQPDGTIVTISPDGKVTSPIAIQVSTADLPALPSDLAGWGSEINERLLGILRNMLSDTEFEAYRQTEQGKSFYELMDWRLRSINFLVTAPQ